MTVQGAPLMLSSCLDWTWYRRLVSPPPGSTLNCSYRGKGTMETWFNVDSGGLQFRTPYLFLSSHPLLVPLPPGRVVDVVEGFISCSDSTRSEELQRRNQVCWSDGRSRESFCLSTTAKHKCFHFLVKTLFYFMNKWAVNAFPGYKLTFSFPDVNIRSAPRVGFSPAAQLFSASCRTRRPPFPSPRTGSTSRYTANTNKWHVSVVMRWC